MPDTLTLRIMDELRRSAYGRTAFGLSEFLGEKITRVSALLADLKRRGLVEAFGDPRHYRYRFVAMPSKIGRPKHGS